MNTVFLLFAKYGSPRLNVEQIADYMNITVPTVRNLISSESMPFAVYKEGKHNYADIQDVARTHDENIETARQLRTAHLEKIAAGVRHARN